MPDSAPQIRYAGFWLRVFAGMIDGIVISFLLSAIVVSIASLASQLPELGYNYLRPVLSAWIIFLGLTFSLFYFSFLLSSSWQATVGMRVFSLKITDYDYKRISFGIAFIRELSTILSAAIFNIGYFMIAFTKKKQGLHDLIANTYVIRT